MNGEVTLREALFVAGKEGLVRETYKDSVGVETWGYGVTSKSGHSVGRYNGKKASYEKCAEIYAWLLERYLADVLEAFEGHELTAYQRTAALSFHWNTGAIKTASWVAAWKAGDTAEARERFMRWNKPKEIIERRETERDLFFNAAWPAALRDPSRLGKVTVLEYTRVRSSGTPDWGSAKRVNVTPHFKAAMKRLEDPKATTKPSKVPVAGALTLVVISNIVNWFRDDLGPVWEWIGGIF
ncbi:GH24 family phage-related lysozyme (muramidase) [Labrenzia sp. EL_208]|nr:GH24 family phage-related lysozyme (muramidase) [Labrenzia sp. EL_132]MBG6227102.1 GH24 family phage-related lysozyme (muramidase) [Labrenzia sp. EL_208]